MSDIDRQTEFMRLYVKHEAVLRSYILSLLGNWADAEEVLQEVSIKMWLKYPPGDGPISFLRWACTIAQYEVFNFRRKRTRRQSQVFSMELMETLAEEGRNEAEQLQREYVALDECLGKLKHTDRQLLRERYSGSTVKDIATRSNSSVQKLYKVIHSHPI
ncbi:MAG: sigma-70 family RNA polymerase sigma factor [Phycisphaerae bacterium]|nr:sigma-70 family RNA polymerase sigma factor [Phycisphaerae bacterium]